MLGSASLILGGTMLSYSVMETFDFKVDQHTVISPDIPDNFNGLRIVFISDPHYGPVLGRKKLARLISQIKYLQPHLFLLGGDYTQSKMPQKQQLRYLKELALALRQVKAPLGKFAVLGNHDHDETGPDVTREALRSAHIRPIDNEGLWLWKGFQRIRLGGVGDMWYDKQLLDPTLKPIKPRDFVILLSHQPTFVDRINQAKIDLMLTGHTHGGQIIPMNNLPFNTGLLKKKRVKGWLKVKNTELLISNGIGVEFPYIRILNRPQIHLITLQKQNEVFD